MISHLVRASVLAVICATSAATVAVARTPFDGAWSVLIVTQSGTNTLHGNLFEYFRGTALEARNPFDTTNAKRYFQRNQFGGSMGGPVRLP